MAKKQKRIKKVKQKGVSIKIISYICQSSLLLPFIGLRTKQNEMPAAFYLKKQIGDAENLLE